MDDHDDNIFDEDDALDYILYENAEEDAQTPQIRSGCLGLIVILAVPVSLIYQSKPIYQY